MSDMNPVAHLRHDLRTPVNHIVGYAEILADDFRFYLDDATRRDDNELREYWNRTRDVSITRRMFTLPEVVDIRAGLSFGAPRVLHEAGKEGWILFEVAEPRVEVAPGSPLLKSTQGVAARFLTSRRSRLSG